MREGAGSLVDDLARDRWFHSPQWRRQLISHEIGRKEMRESRVSFDLHPPWSIIGYRIGRDDRAMMSMRMSSSASSNRRSAVDSYRQAINDSAQPSVFDWSTSGVDSNNGIDYYIMVTTEMWWCVFNRTWPQGRSFGSFCVLTKCSFSCPTEARVNGGEENTACALKEFKLASAG